MNLKEYFRQHRKAFDDEQMSSKADATFEARLKDTLHQPKRSKVV